MVQLTRIYTKSGDKGKTSLGSGQRVPKQSLRIEAIGAVDEANAAVGLITCSRKDSQETLQRIQNDLFDLGADLCFLEEDKPERALDITLQQIQRLEKEIDECNSGLAPLTSFVLPGGRQASAQLHFARTVVRRAERAVCALADQEAINPCVLQYLNRLSDLLFVLARVENEDGKADILWQPGKTRNAMAS